MKRSRIIFIVLMFSAFVLSSLLHFSPSILLAQTKPAKPVLGNWGFDTTMSRRNGILLSLLMDYLWIRGIITLTRNKINYVSSTRLTSRAC